jgi:mitochondrial fission protein ELM1
MRILWILADGKRGHENQSLGLAEALARIAPWSSHLIDLPCGESWWLRLARLRESIALLPQPEIIIAAGHSTHALLLSAGWLTSAKTVLLMKPSLPLSWFDYCFIPKHDVKPDSKLKHKGCMITTGAINRMCYDSTLKDGSAILLVGGPSRVHGWDSSQLLEQIIAVVRADSERRWYLTNSPRTPPAFLATVKEALPEVQVFPVGSTPANWLTQALSVAEVAWVTEDSVSMVYESLTAGAKVGIFAMPTRKKASKHSRGLTELAEKKQVVTFIEWQKTTKLLHSPQPIAEADRCARYLLDQL